MELFFRTTLKAFCGCLICIGVIVFLAALGGVPDVPMGSGEPFEPLWMVGCLAIGSLLISIGGGAFTALDEAE